MSKVAVVYWSGTGNTEAMASAVVDGVREDGAEAELFTASEFDASMLSSFDAVAFGCPSMGSEQLEDSASSSLCLIRARVISEAKKLRSSAPTDGATANG